MGQIALYHFSVHLLIGIISFGQLVLQTPRDVSGHNGSHMAFVQLKQAADGRTYADFKCLSVYWQLGGEKTYMRCSSQSLLTSPVGPGNRGEGLGFVVLGKMTFPWLKDHTQNPQATAAYYRHWHCSTTTAGTLVLC